MTKAIAYIRVSSDDQDNSIEVQKERIISYCKFQNLEIIATIIDKDISGFTEFETRPGGQKATKLLQEKQASTIIAIKPDRLFRNTVDGLTTVDKWNNQGITLHIIDMGGASFSTKTAIGRMIFTTLIANAQFERDLTAERTSAVLQAKKAAGKVYCRSKYGFDKLGERFIRNEEEQKVICLIMQMKESRNSNEIATILNNLGHKTKTGKPFYHSTVQSIINQSYNQAS